jgi:hypothetical protein
VTRSASPKTHIRSVFPGLPRTIRPNAQIPSAEVRNSRRPSTRRTHRRQWPWPSTTDHQQQHVDCSIETAMAIDASITRWPTLIGQRLASTSAPGHRADAGHPHDAATSATRRQSDDAPDALDSRRRRRRARPQRCDPLTADGTTSATDRARREPIHARAHATACPATTLGSATAAAGVAWSTTHLPPLASRSLASPGQDWPPARLQGAGGGAKAAAFGRLHAPLRSAGAYAFG